MVELGASISLEPDGLSDARRQARVREDVRAGRWREALDRLGRVTTINRGYKDVQTLMAHAERELATLEAHERRARTVAEAVQQTVLLTNTGQGWMIYEREADEPDPPLVPCH